MFGKGSSVIQLTPRNFDASGKINHPALKNKKGIICYLASWCGYCVRAKPIIEEVAGILGSSFPIFYIDNEAYPDFVSKTLKIKSYPTIRYIDRTGKPYKDYSSERTVSAMLSDICIEASVCGKR